MTTLIHPGAPKMATEIPASVTTPDVIETRLGTLRLSDGFPDDETVAKVYDNLDFQRGVDAFINNISPVTLVPLRKAITSFGPPNTTVLIFEALMDSKTLIPAPNSETVYTFAWIDLKDGPVVAEIPSGVVGMALDAWSRYVCDIGTTGPDQGKGGKYLFLPPDFTAVVPEGYYTYKSPTFGNLFFIRGFLSKGDPMPAVQHIKNLLRLYPLSKISKPPPTAFINGSGKYIEAISPLDFSFYGALNEIVQEEPNDAMDPETLGVLASIGIEKGKPFAPDARMTSILTEAAMVASVTARALTYRTRLDVERYPHSAWQYPNGDANYDFLRDNVRLLDLRARTYFWGGFGSTPAGTVEMVGLGAQYACAFVDSNGRPFDGGKTYKLHLPPHIPVKNFWSILVYDNQTRTMLQTDQRFPSVSSEKAELAVNADSSVDVYFGPTAPAGKEHNWVQTLPGKGFNLLLRLYGPLEPWFDKSWQPGEIEEIDR